VPLLLGLIVGWVLLLMALLVGDGRWTALLATGLISLGVAGGWHSRSKVRPEGRDAAARSTELWHRLGLSFGWVAIGLAPLALYGVIRTM
jgi:uncharacterized membrane protein